MKKVRKRKKSTENSMKLSDLIEKDTENFSKFDKFDEKLLEFQRKNCSDQVKIWFVPFVVLVFAPNRLKWTKENHLCLCENFGLKLAKYTYVCEADKAGVTYTYVSVSDENIDVLDFDSVF